MAAGLSMTRSPMLRVDEPRTYKGKQGDEDDLEIAKCQQILKARRELSEKAGNSDHALLAVIYSEWESNRGNSSRTRYCNSLGLSFPAMKELEQLYNLLNAALTNVGFPDSQEANSNTGSRRIMHACAVSAMSPSQLVKVVRPKTTYDETAQGAREKDNRSKDLKLFIRLTPAEAQTNAATFKEEQVFVHPSSSNFATGTFSFPWLVYFQLLRTGKAYLRDVTECSPYALLLFGGDLTVQASKDLVFINNWACLSANARIGSLVGGLRREVDKLLTLKIADPSVDISNTDTMRLIVKIIMTDGLG
jgi:ATP-dependent RNA helicase DHX57